MARKKHRASWKGTYVGTGAAVVALSALWLHHASATPEKQAQAGGGGDLIVNGGFENPALTAGNTSETRSVTDWGGKALLRGNGMAAAAQGRQAVGLFGDLHQEFTTEPGRKIRWRIAAQRNGEDSSTALIFGSPNGSGRMGVPLTTAPHADWKVFSGTYVVPPGQDHTEVRIKEYKMLTGTAAFVDDLRVEYEPTVAGAMALAPLHLGEEHRIRSTVEHTGGGALESAVLAVPVPSDVDPRQVRVARIVDGREEEVANLATFDDGILSVPLGDGAASGKGGLVQPGQKFVVDYTMKTAAKADSPRVWHFGDLTLDHRWAGETHRMTLVDGTKVPVATADLVLPDSGTFSKTRYTRGETAELTVDLMNKGPQDAHDALLRIRKPEGLDSFVLAGQHGGDPATCQDDDRTRQLMCSLGRVDSGEALSLRFTGTVTSTEGHFSTAVDLSDSSTADPDVTDNHNTYDSGATNDVDLRATADILTEDGKPVEEGAVRPGQKVLLTAKVANNGPSRPDDVTVRVPLPAGTALDGAGGDGLYENGLWTIAGIEPGGTASLNLRVTVPAEHEDLELVAGIESFGDLHEKDLKNNESRRKVAVARSAELNATLTTDRGADGLPYQPGDRVTYTVKVANSGPSTARNVQVAHVMPEGMVATAGPGGAPYDAAKATWTVPTIAPGKAATLTIVGIVPADTGTLTQRVCVTGSDVPDSRGEYRSCGDKEALEQHTATHDLHVAQQAAVAVKLTSDKAQAVPGQRVTWTVEATNSGPSTAKGLRIRALPAEGIAEPAADAGSGTFDQEAGIWEPADLPAGGRAVLRFTGTVRPDLPVVTTAGVAGSGTPLRDEDKVSGADVRHTLTVRQQADLQDAITAEAETVKAGEKGSVTVSLSNAGPSTARRATVELALPPALRALSHDAGTGFDAKTGTWKAGDIESGGSRTLTLGFTAAEVAEYRFDVLATTSEADDPATCVDICASALVTATAGPDGKELADDEGDTSPGSDPGRGSGSDGAKDPSGAPAGESGAGSGAKDSGLDRALAATGAHALAWGLGAAGAAGLGVILLIVSRRRS
ncbi:DUF11 domain-containing protein [Streptomyces bambusae]|uniref:COG1361 S-layer family protein n=1 Tax=Streptomyces bambusae TaxID=1550616 RepID=UPI001CFC50F0|nr:DUF11 domain-containing protein [Streptomyces bambusae]MCB5167359.1 DUF11 domain-containing protein [Streptomyces bambusae]